MTDVLPPPALTIPEPAPVDPPLAEPKRRHLSTGLLAAAIVVSAVAAGGFLFTLRPVLAPTTSAAGSQFCDPGMVTAHAMTHDGVALSITAPGPDVVTVDVYNSPEHRRMFQQVTRKGAGATFALWDFSSGHFDRIDVTTKTGMFCTVGKGDLDKLNMGL